MKLTKSTLGIVDPVRCEESAESSHEEYASIVVDAFSEFRYSLRISLETKVVHEELHAGTADCNTTLESIDGLPVITKVVRNSREQTIFRDYWLVTDVV